MQEAFVAALLAIARGDKEEAVAHVNTTTTEEDSRSTASMSGVTITEDLDDGWVGIATVDRQELEGLALWVEIKKQIEILREGMEEAA